MFEAKLVRLIEDAQSRRALARAAYDFVKSRRLLSQHFHARYDWYREMCSRLPQLTNDLRQRVPHLFIAL